MQSNFAMLRRTGLIDTEEKIIESLVFAPSKGISKQNLIQNTGFDQSTIYRRTKVLEKKGFVKIIKKGQRTSYILTNDVLRDRFLSAIIIGRISYKELIKKKIGIDNYGFRFPSKDNNQFYIINMKPGRDDLELLLFDYSRNIGSLIIFLLIYLIGSNDNAYKNTSEIERNKVIQSVLEMTIRKWLSNLLGNKYFINTIHQSINLLSSIGLKVAQKDLQNNFFDKRIFDKIMSSFEKLFPDVFSVMNNLIQELPKRIESEKEFLNFENDKYLRSTKCEHKYGKKERNEGKTLQTCEECGNIKEIKTKKSDLIQLD
jgi:Fe2+ or Zn2+ uptake regulation protein